MKVTKHEHSCLVIELAGDTLVIDPGMFTGPLDDLRNVVAIVVTHEHADHWTAANLWHVLDSNPDALIIGPSGVARAIDAAAPRETLAGALDRADTIPVTIVQPGDNISAGAFTLRFFGGRHAEIHRSIPIIDNLGVLVNDELYYAGDSFYIPEGLTVPTLAVPAGAPWLKIGEVIDFVEAVAPRRSFPVHEMVLSVAGKSMANDRISEATKSGGGVFFPLEPGESLDL